MRLPRHRQRPILLGACGIAGVATLLGAPVWAAVLGVMVTAFAIGIRGGGAGGDVDTSGLSSADDSGDAGGDSDGGSE